MSEKLTLHQRPNQCGAIDSYELSCRVNGVDGSGHHFLAGPCLAENQHGPTRLTQLFYLPVYLPHARGVSDERPREFDRFANHPGD
jgi:hypothetical protein